MQNWSCMHPCGHSSIKFFLLSCDTRAQDSFSLFKSTQCFQNTFFYQFVHSFESILGVRKNFSQHLPFKCVHTFFPKLVKISKIFQRKVGNYLFSQACCFLARQPLLFFFFLLILFLLALFLLSFFP